MGPGCSASWNRAYISPFGTKYQRHVSARSKWWDVTLHRWSACPGEAVSHECFHFRAVGRSTGEQVRFEIKNETAMVDAITLVGRSRAAILGRVSANVAVVSVVDLAAGRVADRFVCLSPQISPRGRFVAFVKWSSRELPPHLSVSDEYLAYDLSRTPGYNRTPAGRGPSDIYDAGWPMYPPGAANAPLDNVVQRTAVASAHVMSSDGFWWLGAARVAFADTFEGTVSLVVADLASGIRHPAVSVTSLMGLGVLNPAKCSNLSPAAFFVKDISRIKGNPNRVCLLFRTWEPACLARRSAVVELSKATGPAATGTLPR